MRTLRTLHLGLLLCAAGLTSAGCSKRGGDEAIHKQLVGAWSFNPRTQLPPEKIDDVAFETPDQMILQFEPTQALDNGGAQGSFAEYKHVPKLVHSSDHWEVRRGKWFVLDGKLTLTGYFDEVLRVVSSSAVRLKLDGIPLLPCKEACDLRPLNELPEGARAALPR